MENRSMEGIKPVDVYLPTDRGYDIPGVSWISEDDTALLLALRGFGGGVNSTAVEEIAKSVKSKGIGTFSFTWPAHGNSNAQGEKLTVDNCLADIDDVLTYIKDSYPDRTIYCFGTSFGGYLASLYHNIHPDEFAKIILRSPAIKMADIVKGFMDEDQWNRFASGEKMNFGFDRPLILDISTYKSLLAYPSFDVPLKDPGKFEIIQGDKDEIVSPDDTRSYAERNGIPIHWVHGADHQYSTPEGLASVIKLTTDMLIF